MGASTFVHANAIGMRKSIHAVHAGGVRRFPRWSTSFTIETGTVMAHADRLLRNERAAVES
jgi:hypothetical protein